MCLNLPVAPQRSAIRRTRRTLLALALALLVTQACDGSDGGRLDSSLDESPASDTIGPGDEGAHDEQPDSVHSAFAQRGLLALGQATIPTGALQVVMLGAGRALEEAALRDHFGGEVSLVDLTDESASMGDLLELAEALPRDARRLVLLELSCFDTHRAARDTPVAEEPDTRIADGPDEVASRDIPIAERPDTPVADGPDEVAARDTPSAEVPHTPIVEMSDEVAAALADFPSVPPADLEPQVEACRQIHRGAHAELRVEQVLDTLRRLLASGATVILVEAPLHPSTRRLFERSVRMELLEQLSVLAGEGLRVITEQQTGPFPPSEFRDLVHLAPVGRARVARELSRRLRDELPPRATEEDG